MSEDKSFRASVAPPSFKSSSPAAPTPPEQPAPAVALRSLPLHWFGLAAAAMMLLGVVGPWVDAVIASRSGLSTDDGKLVAVIGIIAAVMAVQAFTPIAVGVVGGLGAAVCVTDLIEISSKADGTPLSGLVSPGWGLYLAVVGSLAVIAYAIAAWRARRGSV